MAHEDPQVPGWHIGHRVDTQRDPAAPQLQAYVDAAFADTAECKSTAGWLYLFHGALIAYDSTTIKRVVTSSTEAECCALVMVAKENVWQRRIIHELTDKPMVPTPVFGDNSASITAGQWDDKTEPALRH